MSATEFELEVRQDPAHYVYFTLNATSKLVCGFSAVIFGYNLHETTGGAGATVKILDGADTSGQAVAVVQIASGTSVQVGLDSRGVLLKNGVTINVTSGQAEGTVYYRHVRR